MTDASFVYDTLVEICFQLQPRAAVAGSPVLAERRFVFSSAIAHASGAGAR